MKQTAFIRQQDRNWGAKPKPVELYPHYLKLMAETGRYLISKFETYSKNE